MGSAQWLNYRIARYPVRSLDKFSMKPFGEITVSTIRFFALLGVMATAGVCHAEAVWPEESAPLVSEQQAAQHTSDGRSAGAITAQQPSVRTLQVNAPRLGDRKIINGGTYMLTKIQTIGGKRRYYWSHCSGGRCAVPLQSVRPVGPAMDTPFVPYGGPPFARLLPLPVINHTPMYGPNCSGGSCSIPERRVWLRR